MPYVPATCPHCGGGLKLDSNTEKGYCMHCGSLIDFSEAIKTIQFNSPIEIHGFESYPTLIKRIENDLKTGNNQNPEFKEYLIKALELDPDNKYLYGLVSSEIWKAKIEDNTIVSYEGTAKKVTVPNGIAAIGSMAFARCHNLVEIVLPKSLKQIMTGAFIYESKLTISTYNGTYAAKYAMSSPAKLNLLDYKNSTKKNIENIEVILRELATFKRNTIDNIETYFNKVYSINWTIVIILLLIPSALIVFAMPFFGRAAFYVGATIFIALFALIATPILIMKSGYDEILCKTAIKRQTNLFIKKSNALLRPLGIIDFQYHRDIFEDSNIDLDSEVKGLQIARNKLLNMDIRCVYKKPDIKYSIIDYLKGKKPIDYDRN